MPLLPATIVAFAAAAASYPTGSALPMITHLRTQRILRVRVDFEARFAAT